MNNLQTYNLTLPCVSPLIKWSPGKERGDVWNLTYTNSSWSDYTPGAMGVGRPGHSSSLAGSSMRFEYTGKNAWIFGTVEGWEEKGEFGYIVTCDGDSGTKGYEPLGLPGNLMGGCQGMAYGDHTMTLYVQGGKEVQVWCVTVQAGAGSVNSTLSNRTEITGEATGSFNSVVENSTGVWEIRKTLYGPDENSPSPEVAYPRVRTTLPGSSLTFISPIRSAAIYLIGTIGYDHTTYGVQLDGQTPWKGNASSSWGAFDQVLYHSPLDPDRQHTVIVTNLAEDNSSSFDVSKVIFLQSSSKETRTGDLSTIRITNGAIVGMTVGGIALLAIISAVIFLLLKRKRKRAEQERRNGWGPVDLTDEELRGLPKQGDYTAVSQVQEVQPYLAPMAPSHSAGRQIKGLRTDPRGDPSVGMASQGTIQSNEGYDPMVLHNPLVSANPEVQSPAQATSRQMVDLAPPVTQEIDAGPVQPEVIPPSYNEKWRNPLRPRN